MSLQTLHDLRDCHKCTSYSIQRNSVGKSLMTFFCTASISLHTACSYVSFRSCAFLILWFSQFGGGLDPLIGSQKGLWSLDSILIPVAKTLLQGTYKWLPLAMTLGLLSGWAWLRETTSATALSFVLGSLVQSVFFFWSTISNGWWGAAWKFVPRIKVKGQPTADNGWLHDDSAQGQPLCTSVGIPLHCILCQEELKAVQVNQQACFV